MFNRNRVQQFLMIGLCAGLVGCGSADPILYKGIESSPYLTPHSGHGAEHIPYRYSKTVDWSKYHSIIVDPVTIYTGADNQFGDMSEKDKADLAKYMQSQFCEKLATRFRVVETPQADTLRLKLTLTGAAATKRVLGTFTRIDMGGCVYHIVQSIRGGEGMMTGSVIYAVEIYNASSSSLLSACIAKQYPKPMNIGATIGALTAAQKGIEKGAEEIVGQLTTPSKN